jgi:hypothetical protein
MQKILKHVGLWTAAAVLAVSQFATRECGAQLVLENFESYADQAALSASWAALSPAQQITVPASLSTDIAHTGSQSMRINYNLGPSPYFGQNAHDIGVQTWASYDRLSFWYLGQSNNSTERIDFRYLNEFNVQVGSTFVIVAGTKANTWTRAIVPLTGNLSNVKYIRVGLAPTNYGSGVVWIDDISLVPEPTSLGMLCLGAIGLVLRRRTRSA